jgi:putative ABC transport system permease protein
VGQTIDVEGMPFQVIGVMASQGSNGFQNLDNEILIPITTEMNLFANGSQSVSTIAVSAASQTVMNQVEQEITSTLRVLHHLGPGQSSDFTIQNQASILSTLQSVSQVFTILLAGVAGISLVVGGIGIMNIMLVSVTERTREIGIRKAIGARRGVILAQFLTESVMLSLAGGAIGVLLGVGASALIGYFMHAGNVLSLTSVLLSSGFALVVGVVFGVYPARKASRLKPIDALRYE